MSIYLQYFTFCTRRTLDTIRQLSELTLIALLTAYVNPPGGLHGHSVAVVRIARDVLHVGRDVVNDRDHVPRGVLPHQVSTHVERNGGSRVAEGQAENGHGTALRYVVRRMHSGGLQVRYTSVNPKIKPEASTHIHEGGQGGIRPGHKRLRGQGITPFTHSLHVEHMLGARLQVVHPQPGQLRFNLYELLGSHGLVVNSAGGTKKGKRES